MHFTSLLTLSAAVVSVAASPFKFPLPNGFPNPSPSSLLTIENDAQGALPNSPLPKTLTAQGVTTLQLIALNEIFEVAFFTDLISNITSKVYGYTAQDILPLDREYVLKALTAIVNQEELHALGVNGILESAGQPPIKPCKYQFPVTNFKAAIALAKTFTDVVLGTLPVAQTAFAADANDEIGLVPLFGSVIAQEGEQVGWFRSSAKLTPSAAPFLTGAWPSFAFTALQSFIVPNSCPLPLSKINLPTFGPLTVITTPEAKNMTLEFSVPGTVSATGHEIVYLSGQNEPVNVPISKVTTTAGVSTFSVEFPFESEPRFANGLTIAALVKGCGTKFTTANDVSAATLFGPGLIEVA